MEYTKNQTSSPRDALEWFQKAVYEKTIDPLNLSLANCPDSILQQLDCEITPDEQYLPNQALVDVGFFLFLWCKDREFLKKTGREASKILVSPDEVFDAVVSLAIMVGMEKLQRKGLLKYYSEGSWYDGSGNLYVSDFKPISQDPNFTEAITKFLM